MTVVWTPERIAKQQETRRKNRELERIRNHRVRHSALKLQQRLRLGIGDMVERIRELRGEIENLQLVSKVAPAVGIHECRRFPTGGEIVGMARHLGEYAGTACGVYFLIKDDVIVYVGQSVNVSSRVAMHAKYREFTHAVYIPAAKDKLDILESLYIHMLKPALNGAGARNTVGAMYAPLTATAVHEILAGVST